MLHPDLRLSTSARLPNASRWWKAALAITFLWLCAGYLLAAQCRAFTLFGPCRQIMQASPLTGYAAIAWLFTAFLVIPVLALVAMAQTYRRVMATPVPEPEST